MVIQGEIVFYFCLRVIRQFNVNQEKIEATERPLEMVPFSTQSNGKMTYPL